MIIQNNCVRFILVSFHVAVIKISWEIQLKGERAYSNSKFKSSVHLVGEAKVAGAWSSWLDQALIRRHQVMDAWGCSYIPGSQSGNGATHSRWVFPAKCIKHNLSQACQRPCCQEILDSVHLNSQHWPSQGCKGQTGVVAISSYHCLKYARASLPGSACYRRHAHSSQFQNLNSCSFILLPSQGKCFSSFIAVSQIPLSASSLLMSLKLLFLAIEVSLIFAAGLRNESYMLSLRPSLRFVFGGTGILHLHLAL